LAPGGALPPRAAITPEMLAPHADKFQPGARVLYRTGWDRRFAAAEYFSAHPSLTTAAAEWIAARRITLLGMDAPSPSAAWKEAHEILLRPGVEIVVVENLTRLDLLPERFTFIGFPLNVQGRDGAPVRAVALVE
ncbi:MAG: cyclase family protein, partial [Verrucomicrobiae bacterium]